MSGIKQCQFPPVEAHPKPTISCCVHHLREENSLISLFHDLKKKRSYISDARTDHNCSGRSFPITTIEGIRRPLTGRSVAQSSGLPVHILKDPWASYWNPSNSQHIRLYMSECALEYYCMNLGMSACVKKPFKWSIWLENLNINVCSVEQTRQDKICQMSR